MTPDSLLALHEAGYRAVSDRIGTGRILDVGCGQGFESARFLGPGRDVVGVDYSADAVATAAARYGPDGLRVAQMDALDLGLRAASFDGACSSHLIEHFTDPEAHVRRAGPGAQGRRARLRAHPEQAGGLREPVPPPSVRTGPSCGRCSGATSVTCGSAGSTPCPDVKADFEARRVKANKLLRLDVFDLRHRMPARVVRVAPTRGSCPWPTGWWPGRTRGASTGITADDWFVTDDPDDTTLVLFAVARGAAPGRPRG